MVQSRQFSSKITLRVRGAILAVLNGPAEMLLACTITNPLEADLVLDNHLESPRIFVAMGFSGMASNSRSQLARLLPIPR